MVSVLEKHKRKVALGGVMLAIAMRKEVLDFLLAHAEGATADEVAAALGRTPFTVWPRCKELLKKQLIEDSGRRRENLSGKSAIVWVAVGIDG
jgi:predicted transcriptional regulator